MQCVNPYHLSTGFDVQCGVCVHCRINRASMWALRIINELESWNHRALFITLTYKDECLPEGGTLVKSDIQKYWKRLRKMLGKLRKIKYFCCGEYGEKKGRPHYHAIVFGLTIEDKKLIESCWNHGMIDIGTVTYDSARYVAEYTNKKITGKQEKEVYLSRGLIPTFSVLFGRFWLGVCAEAQGTDNTGLAHWISWTEISSTSLLPKEA